ncbi:hypothetical protein RB600_000401 [Gaeumannomyces tritici]
MQHHSSTIQHYTVPAEFPLNHTLHSSYSHKHIKTMPSPTALKTNKKNQQPGEQADVPPQLQDLHCFTETNGVITTTMFDVPGYRVVRVLGAVYGLTVRSRNWAAGLGMAVKSIVGGELKWFTNLLYSSRNDAISRVVAECQSRGGNAVIALRFDAGELGGFSQVCAYGTAAVIERVDADAPDYPQLVVRTDD